MTISIEQKNGSLKTYSSVDEMMKSWEEEEKARPIWKKIIDWIDYKIIYNLVNIFHPRYNYRRLIRLYQRITWGWDESDMWSLDYKIAKKFKGYFEPLALLQPEYAPVAWSLNYVVDDLNCDIDSKDYEKRKELEKRYDEGMKILNNKFLLLDSLFIKQFTEYVIPRLKLFVRTFHGVPSDLCPVEDDYYPNKDDDNDEQFEQAKILWETYLSKMIIAFEIINETQYPSSIVLNDKVKEGLDLFFKYFRGLWD